MILDEIAKLNTSIENIFKMKLSDFNISIGQFKILKVIYSSDVNEISAKELTGKINQDKRLLSLNLSKLEDKGYISRSVMTNDKREKNIYLTDSSLEILEDIIGVEKEIEDSIEFSLPNKDMYLKDTKMLLEVLDKI